MKLYQLFPAFIILLDLCAAGMYAYYTGDWRRVTLWLCAAVSTYVVTF
jgi:hypothetical protein